LSVPSTMRAERSSIDVILQNYVILVSFHSLLPNKTTPEAQ